MDVRDIINQNVSALEKVTEIVCRYKKQLIDTTRFLVSFVGGEKRFSIIENIIGSDIYVSNAKCGFNPRVHMGRDAF